LQGFMEILFYVTQMKWQPGDLVVCNFFVLGINSGLNIPSLLKG
jgi:hypothetical protein